MVGGSDSDLCARRSVFDGRPNNSTVTSTHFAGECHQGVADRGNGPSLVSTIASTRDGSTFHASPKPRLVARRSDSPLAGRGFGKKTRNRRFDRCLRVQSNALKNTGGLQETEVPRCQNTGEGSGVGSGRDLPSLKKADNPRLLTGSRVTRHAIPVSGDSVASRAECLHELRVRVAHRCIRPLPARFAFVIVIDNGHAHDPCAPVLTEASRSDSSPANDSTHRPLRSASEYRVVRTEASYRNVRVELDLPNGPRSGATQGMQDRSWFFSARDVGPRGEGEIGRRIAAMHIGSRAAVLW